MNQRIHPEGPEISPVAIGVWRLHEWNLSKSEIQKWIEQCVDFGITTFDHADIYGDYGNESLFGEALSNIPDIRNQILIVTKCNICLKSDKRPDTRVKHYNSSPAYIRKSVESSLVKLHTEYIDLLLLHRPDPLMDASATAEELMKLINEGKVKYAGVSNFTPSQFRLLNSKMDVPLVTNQVECSLLHTEPIFDGTFDQAQQLRARPMLWSPFAGGRVFKSNEPQAQRVRDVLHKLSQKYDVGMNQIALAWLLNHPSNPIPVVGTGKSDRAKAAADAVNIDLERQDWYELLEASIGAEIP